MNIRFGLIIISILMLVSCSKNQSASAILEDDIKLKTDMIYQLELKNEVLKENIKNKDIIIRDLESSIDKLESQYEDMNYFEDEEIYNSYNMCINRSEELRILPYYDSHSIATLDSNVVRVITTLENKNREKWALIENIEASFVGKNGYGYVPYDSLDELDESRYYEARVNESINGISIGDYKEQVIGILGKEYFVEKNEVEWSINYDGLQVILEHTTEQVVGFRVCGKGYHTNKGYAVGDNAKEAITYYKNTYQMNGIKSFNKNLPETAFLISDRYFLLIEYDTEQLEDASIITNIILYPIDWIYG